MKVEHVPSDRYAEVCLSDGRNVEIFRIKYRHIIGLDPNSKYFTAKLLSRTTRVDGEQLSPMEWLDMFYEDVSKVSDTINRHMGLP